MMDLKNRMAEEFEKRKDGLLVFALLLGLGFFVNRGVTIKGLYMDDLYLWSCYGEQSFLEYVFPMGSTRFRFLYYLISWLELAFVGNHVTWIVPINIVLNAAIAFTIYRIAFRIGGRRFVSIALSVAYLLSRMAYYQIGQLYGTMESMGLWAAIGILYFLYRYVNERDGKSYLLAHVLYFCASFIHERYMALIPVLLLALLLGQGEKVQKSDGDMEAAYGKSRRRRTEEEYRTPKWQFFLLSIGIFGLIMLIRLFTIGTLSPAGTGGTDVADTFDTAEAVAHAWEQVGFVFGVGTGPDYLCGMTFADSPDNIKNMIHACWGILGVLVAVFAVRWALDSGRRLSHLKNVLLFLAFIALCIGSSSVTIRVEMRWVYVVYAAALLFLSYLSAFVGKAGILVFAYMALLFPVEGFYRDTWDVLHLWPNQLRYNSLAEETVGKYGEDFFDKELYIIGNTYEMSDFTAETFFKVYAPDPDTEFPVHFIDSDFDLKEITDDMVILREDPENNAYQDVTSYIKDERYRLAYGSYEDGWIDEHAKIVFLNGNRDKMVLSFYYPGKITGNEVCEIKMNGKRLPDLVFTENSMSWELDVAPYQRISLEFSCNFYVKNAKEKRGEENLAMIVHIKDKE